MSKGKMRACLLQFGKQDTPGNCLTFWEIDFKYNNNLHLKQDFHFQLNVLQKLVWETFQLPTKTDQGIVTEDQAKFKNSHPLLSIDLGNMLAI